MTETFSPTCVTSESVKSAFCEGDLKDFPGQCATLTEGEGEESGDGGERRGERQREEGRRKERKRMNQCWSCSRIS